jgi:hypothetical protein
VFDFFFFLFFFFPQFSAVYFGYSLSLNKNIHTGIAE